MAVKSRHLRMATRQSALTGWPSTKARGGTRKGPPFLLDVAHDHSGFACLPPVTEPVASDEAKAFS